MYIKQQYDLIDINKKTVAIDGNETVVQNINRVIKYIQNNPIYATKKRFQFAGKNIKELNDILLNPIELISTRPVQKTYPNVNGMYLLLRSMGIIKFETVKKDILMKVDEELLKNWNKLNHSEQYFTLLELWLIHSNPKELLDAFHAIPLLQLHRFFDDNNATSFEETIENIRYMSELYSLALYDMFGFVDIKSTVAIKKNQWNISDIVVKPLIKRILPMLAIDTRTMQIFLLVNADLGYFQPKIRQRYKEYVNTLQYPKIMPTKGVYRLKISLGRAYRTIEIDAKKSFEYLADAILEQFYFDDDHLYEFTFFDIFGKMTRVDNTDSDTYYLKNLPLKELESFQFIFDFGANWEFNIFIEDIDKSREIESVKLIKSHGEAPEQYPEYDEEW